MQQRNEGYQYGLQDATKKSVATQSNELQSDKTRPKASKQKGKDKHLVSIYDNIIREANLWSSLSLIAAALGILLIFGGIIVTLFLANITVGLLTSLSGIIVELVNQLAFHPSESAIKRRQVAFDRLDRDSRITLATEIAMSTSEKVREELLKQIVTSLIPSEETEKEVDKTPATSKSLSTSAKGSVSPKKKPTS